MARKAKPEEPPPSDIPFWFITYSDVITLMMTFFILLLTFATSEPENFVQMQVAVFQGSGGSGVAGKAESSVDQDSIVYRERPSSGRRTKRGSESPPQETDPTFASMDKGLKGMEKEPEAILAQGHAIVLPLSPLVANGEITASWRTTTADDRASVAEGLLQHPTAGFASRRHGVAAVVGEIVGERSFHPHWKNGGGNDR